MNRHPRQACHCPSPSQVGVYKCVNREHITFSFNIKFFFVRLTTHYESLRVMGFIEL